MPNVINRRKQIHQNLILRAKIIRVIRQFFIANDFLEVETPVRIPAPAPEPYISAISSENWYLQTSPELCMKRLLCAGYEKIFQICKCFRRDERGSRHLSEFTMLEWYEAGATYDDLMTRCENMIECIRHELHLPRVLNFRDCKVDLNPPWPRLTLEQAFNDYSQLGMNAALSADKFDEIISFDIEPHLGVQQPVFLYDYPAERSPLAASKPGMPHLAQRFELYTAGLEICNGFTELIDPDEQRKRFELELARRNQQGAPEYPLPEKFLADLEFMPSSAGNALGIDRLVMLFANATSIDDVVAFIPEEL
jgi:elongation factor P--(R)-beta-lysine ligase